MRENIFFALAEAKCPILKMQSSNMSLEEVFLKLTDNAGRLCWKRILFLKLTMRKSFCSREKTKKNPRKL